MMLSRFLFLSQVLLPTRQWIMWNTCMFSSTESIRNIMFTWIQDCHATLGNHVVFLHIIYLYFPVM